MALTDFDRTRAIPTNVIEAVRAVYHDLRKSERKVADACLPIPHASSPRRWPRPRKSREVSQPTVVRFCIGIGCLGFQEFKLRLAHSLALGTPATHSVLSSADASTRWCGKIFDYTITSLDWARNHLDLSAMEEAVRLLESAQAIEFFGFGASAIVATDAQQKFPLFGAPCGAQSNSHQQIMAASMMRPNDVAVAISNTGRTRSVIEIARTARARGAKVIGITGSELAACRRMRCQAHRRDARQHKRVYADDLAHRGAGCYRYPVDCGRLPAWEEHQERFREMKQRLNDLQFGGEP